jgi:tetratricopeptide (TPR) repeat protein
VTGVSFHPDGQRLASAGEDGTIIVWDVATGQEALTLRRQLICASSVAFSPDGHRLVAAGAITGGFEGVIVWDTEASSQERQTARDDAFKADAQNASSLRGKAYGRLLRWDKAVADYSKEIDRGRSDARIWFDRGTAYAMLSQYESAAADFARAVKAKPEDPSFWYCHAMANLGANDLQGYGRVCAGMLQQFGNTKDPAIAARVVYTCVPVVEGAADAAEMVRLGKVAVHYQRALASAFYRDGQYEAAIREYQKVGNTSTLGGVELLFLAMAQHKLNRNADARETFAKAEKWIDDTREVAARGDHWVFFQQVEVRHLHSEAKKLLTGK